jgi:hypothetical protein
MLNAGFERKGRHQMRDVWMTMATTDRGAFHLTLANAALFLAAKNGEIETAESIEHYTAAVRATEQQLQDPHDSVSDGVIGSVLGFASHDVCQADYKFISKLII